MTTKKLNSRQARWAEKLAEYDFEIAYRPGKTNPADGLSRRPDYAGDSIIDNATIMLPTLQRKLQSRLNISLRENISGDLSLRAISLYTREMFGSSGSADRSGLALWATTRRQFKAGQNSHISEDQPETETQLAEIATEEDSDAEPFQMLLPRELVSEVTAGETADREMRKPMAELLLELQKRDEFYASDTWREQRQLNHQGVTFHPWTQDEDGLLRREGAVYVPKDPSVRAEILRICHDDPITGGHYGTQQTIAAVRRKYFWKGASRDAEQYVRTCDACQRNSYRRHKPYGQLHPLPVATEPHKYLAMDFITGLPPAETKDKRVVNAVLVIVDRCTKMVELHAVDWETNAEELYEIFIARLLNYGPPRSIVTDRDSRVNSKFWSTICFKLNIQRNMSTAFHPQSDGQTERVNQELERYLRCYVSYHMDNWPHLLQIFESAHNNTPRGPAKVSPRYLLDGTKPEWYVRDDRPQEGEAPSATERIENLQYLRQEAAQALLELQETQARYHNRKHLPRTFKVGEEVLLRRSNIRTKRLKEKLDNRYLGPFPIEGIRRSGQAYELKLPESWPIHNVFHVSLLEPYHLRPGYEPPPPEIIDGEAYWNVEDILDVKGKGGKKQYLIK
jgi:hypothetical protein